MKNLSLLIVGIIIAISSFADGTKTTQTSYSPDPNSGNVGNALNIYLGPSMMGKLTPSLSIFASYEKQMIDPNFTLGPELGFSLASGRMSFYAAAKGVYYVDWLIPNMPDQFDLFLESVAGFRTTLFTSGGMSFGPRFDERVGARWNFNESMSVYVLAGTGSNVASVGLSWKL